MLCSLCPIAVIFFSISVRRNSRELFLISMFVSFEFILVSSEYICINIMSLSLHSFVTFSITWRLPVRRQVVSEKDILAQYTYSIKHRMMSRRSALIFLETRWPMSVTCKVRSSHYTLHTQYTLYKWVLFTGRTGIYKAKLILWLQEHKIIKRTNTLRT